MKKYCIVLLVLLYQVASAQVNVLIQSKEYFFDYPGDVAYIATKVQSILVKNGFRCIAKGDTIKSDYLITIQANSRRGNSVNSLFFAYIDASLSITGKDQLNYIQEFSNIKGGGTDYSGANGKAYKTLAQMISDSVMQILGTKPALAQKKPAPVEKPIPVPSDVDVNIPLSQTINQDTYVVAIGNEDYSNFQTGLNSEVNVEGAANDAFIFSQYCVKTLGIPEKNVMLKTNATLGQMRQTIAKMITLAQLREGKASLIFYFSGHGLPDEETKEPYLIPVDISGSDVKSAVSLNGLYKDLTKYPCKRVTVILDACFSGGARNQGLIALKGVKIKPKEVTLTGNLVVMSSSSGDESSTVYKDKNHGMFTYFLLKKIQSTKGKVTYKNLFDDVFTRVRLESVTVNNKNQTPQITGSPDVQSTWESWNLIE
ncbi:MAG: caspase family protein [Bacteroidales bacterium]|jgi:hypothetical protein|nr:caspase family protein [Bacteroidales bacterium]